MSKVMIISLDGATWTVLDPLMGNDAMPFLRKTITHGTHGNLQSVVPPVTAPAWSSFMTGKQPDKHGVFEFRCFNMDTKCDYITNASYIQSETAWQILSRHNKKVISIGVPYTFPVYPVNGIMVSGMDTPSEDSQYTSPPSLKKIINKKFPDFSPVMLSWDMKDVSNERKTLAYIRELGRKIELKVEIASYFLNEYEWDVAMIHFQETDYLQHALWDKIIESVQGAGQQPVHEEISAFFKRVDSAAADIWNHVNAEDVSFMVISDHGFTEHKGIIYPNAALKNSGMLESGKQESLLYQIKSNIKSSGNPLVRGGYLLQQKVRNSLRKRHKLSVYDKLEMTSMLENFQVNWEKSSAAMIMGSQYAFIYLKEKQYVSECKMVLERIRNKENGEFLFDSILSLDKAYGRIEDANKENIIIAIPREGYSVSRMFKDHEFTTTKFYPGTHNANGIFIAYGKTIKEGLKFNYNLIDIIPTCLYLLGLPIPSDMDGKVAYDILEKDDEVKIEQASKKYFQKQQDYDRESEELIRERLKALGYIE
jgi:predicted AlkP superfamily phosphohydrolase/phosphomutase